MMRHMSKEARSVLASAATFAADKDHCAIHSVDLGIALACSNLLYNLLNEPARSELLTGLEQLVEDEPVFVGKPVDVYVYSDPVKRILAYALEEAQRGGNTHTQPRHLLIGLLRESDCAAARMFQSHGINHSRLRSL